MRILSLILAILLSSHVIAKTEQVELVTTEGVIKLELYSDKAPKTVANFLNYVSSGYYANTQFHRVIAGFMIQGGGFDLQGDRKATQAPIINEANNGLSNMRGTIAMARTNDPNSATSQFFINHNDNVFLDANLSNAGYAVFGKVVEGMDVVDKIAAVPTTTKAFMRDWPATPVLILQAKQLD